MNPHWADPFAELISNCKCKWRRTRENECINKPKNLIKSAEKTVKREANQCESNAKNVNWDFINIFRLKCFLFGECNRAKWGKSSLKPATWDSFEWDNSNLIAIKMNWCRCQVSGAGVLGRFGSVRFGAGWVELGQTVQRMLLRVASRVLH